MDEVDPITAEVYRRFSLLPEDLADPLGTLATIFDQVLTEFSRTEPDMVEAFKAAARRSAGKT